MSNSGPSTGDDARDRVRTDEQITREKGMAEVAGLKAEVAKLEEELASEIQNRKMRHPIAIIALVVMVLQVAASDVIFVWYGDTNAWNISAAAISAWMGTNVIEVVAVVLVIVNYLFPNVRQKSA
jgi:hypothetical protein